MKTFKQFINEYTIIPRKEFFDDEDYENYFKRIDAQKSKYKKVSTPISDVFDVGHSHSGVYHDYALFDKKTGKAVGVFGLDEKPIKQNIIKSGVSVVIPHLMLNAEYQNKGIGKRIYRSFLENGKFVYATNEHTREAKILWDSISKLPGIATQTIDGYRYLGKKEYFSNINESIDFISEGVFDQGIFKAIFLAGGPGSGKSYVTGKSTGGMPLKLVNSDVQFERLMKAANLSFKMPPEEQERRDRERERAKELTNLSMASYIDGRLGLVIDGTGREYDKIEKQVNAFRKIGYEPYMIFVNTSLDTALERNRIRERSVPEDITKQSWKQVQSNMGKFQNLFGQDRFIIVDNNNATEDVLAKVWKRVRKIVDSKVTNSIARDWIAKELEKKKRQ